MPDYSGYAQRPQQDPNLAAWAQIGGNIANIFGLDPAKAAEARRGLQQEDYNEERRQATLRQQAANKRIGELLAGSGFDPSRGEFRDPAAWSEFVQNMGEMGDARQAVTFAPGRAAQAENDAIARENRLYEKRLELENARTTSKEAKDKAEKEAAEREAEIKQASADYRYRRGGAGGVFMDPRITPTSFVNHIQNLSATGDTASGIPAFSGSVLDRSRKVLTPEYLQYLETIKIPAAISDQNIPHLQEKIEEGKVALARAYGVTPDEFKDPQIQSQLDIMARRMIAAQIESYRRNNYDTGTNVDTMEALNAAIAQFKAQPEAKRLNPLKPFYVNVPKVITHDRNGNLLAMPMIIRVAVPIQTIVEDVDMKNPNNPLTWPNFKAARGGM